MATTQKSAPKKTQALLVLGLIVGVVMVTVILIISTESTYLRTSVLPVETNIPQETANPLATTKTYQAESFSISHPINWEPASSPISSPVAGAAHTVGTFTFFTFPEKLTPAHLQTLQQEILKTTDIISWPCVIGNHQAICSAKSSHHLGTIAPLGPRLVQFDAGSTTTLTLIPAPPRNEAEQNLLNSLQLR